MGKIAEFFGKTTKKLLATAVRFPVVCALLVFVAVIVSILVEGKLQTQEELLTRLAFAGVFGAFFGLAAQFFSERNKNMLLWPLRGATIVAGVLFFFLSGTLGHSDTQRNIVLTVWCFILLALAMYLPAARCGADFKRIAISYVKAFFTAALYSGVLFLGLLAIYGAVDLLLVDLNEKLVGHIASAVFIVFAPVYFLALLPRFNDGDDSAKMRLETASSVPRFLDVLVSYISIPLIAVFTLVLLIYFVKIIITLVWPVGQIGPMVLSYSAAGLILLILSAPLHNRFAKVYQKWMPVALIPAVLLQLVSVGIRLRAYGITESRYFVVLFGVFSLVCALYLLIARNKKLGMIALLAACFAVVSILPPVDAFSVSFQSQKSRLEHILASNDMLEGGALTPSEDVSDEDKKEITSIVDYMERMGTLRKLPYIPEQYRLNGAIYDGFLKLFGFERFYGPSAVPVSFVNASLNPASALAIDGFETMVRYNLFSDTATPEPAAEVTVGGAAYNVAQRSEGNHLLIVVTDGAGKEVLRVSTVEFFAAVSAAVDRQGYLLPPESMTLDAAGGGIRLRLIFENVNMEKKESGGFDQIKTNGFLFVGKQ